MTTRAAAAKAPKQTVGIVHGGDRPVSITPEDWAGAWGCDIACVEGSASCFEDHACFAVKRIHIQDISKQSLDDVDVLVMPGGNKGVTKCMVVLARRDTVLFFLQFQRILSTTMDLLYLSWTRILCTLSYLPHIQVQCVLQGMIKNVSSLPTVLSRRVS